MKPRYSLDWILVRLLLGAVIALGCSGKAFGYASVVRLSVSDVTGVTLPATVHWTMSVSCGVDITCPTTLSGTKLITGVGTCAGDCGLDQFSFGLVDSDSRGAFSGTVTVTGAYHGSFSFSKQGPCSANGFALPGDILVPISPGDAGCDDGVDVTAHWSGGAPEAAGTVFNVVVGGVLVQITCDANGCNAGHIPGSQLTVIGGGGPYSVDGGLDTRSWTICGPPGARYRGTPTLGTVPGSVACGATLDVPINSGCAVDPTPTPSPSATVNPSPSATPNPSVSPPPEPSPGPVNFPTPNPVSSIPGGIPNPGHASGTLTKGDIYDAVFGALQESSKTGTWNGADGHFGYGSDPAGEGSGSGNALQSAVDRFTSDLEGASDESIMGKIDAIDSLDLPTSVGDKSSWNVSLPVLGDLTIDVSGFDAPVYTFRALCLAILIVCAWFAMIKIIRSGVA